MLKLDPHKNFYLYGITVCWYLGSPGFLPPVPSLFLEVYSVAPGSTCLSQSYPPDKEMRKKCQVGNLSKEIVKLCGTSMSKQNVIS